MGPALIFSSSSPSFQSSGPNWSVLWQSESTSLTHQYYKSQEFDAKKKKGRKVLVVARIEDENDDDDDTSVCCVCIRDALRLTHHLAPHPKRFFFNYRVSLSVCLPEKLVAIFTNC